MAVPSSQHINPLAYHPSLYQSPNAIPPRTSSTGQQSLSQAASSPPSVAKPVLRPVPEADWLAGGPSVVPQPGHTRNKSSRNASLTSALPPTSFLGVTMAAGTSQQPPPPPDPNRFATEDLNATVRRWTAEKEKVVTGPFDYLYNTPGKDFRSQLIKAFDAWLEVPQESLEIITKVVGLLHTASLLVDDVEDNSRLRRGIPVAHSIFGIPQAINSSNYVYFCALQEVQKLRNPKAITVFTEELINLHRGQGMDLYWRDSLTCPTEDDYLEMVGNKTGGLFRLGIKLMQAESRSLIDCVPVVNIIGLIFQIADDYKNLFSKEYTDNKGMCEDLTEGKFSFPVIHSIRSDPTNLQLLNILKQKTEDEGVKRYAVAYMERTGSFEYTRRVLDVLTTRAKRMIDEVDEGRGRAKGVHKILEKITAITAA
ncbi:Geranylgeranyl pyrophosphate synthase [Coniochaeta hoffmannii]|uniref:Geranylgeranyl pyrophosphate synthase n=1 Tax=Coniochaeta hoffmannii TaxID=91930 RepID=A0AA38W0W4_9PEZI|nr:Geranylgeranyl pyrophosphate synthase [Coniochaeta hoffmannii]